MKKCSYSVRRKRCTVSLDFDSTRTIVTQGKFSLGYQDR